MQKDMSSSDGLVGFLLINKPVGMTSRDCINKLQKLLPKKTKIGHAGTLDRFAQGLLIVGIGRAATRQFQYMLTLDKQYVARAKLSERTDTLDHTGTVIERSDTSVTQKDIEQAIECLRSGYVQTPPIFSALKWQGTRLSSLARGKVSQEALQSIVHKKQKPVQIFSLQLLSFDFPYFTFFAHVSHGTYVRALADDIAQQCGSCATTYFLERTAVGPFRLDDATDLASITSIEDIKKLLRPVATAGV